MKEYKDYHYLTKAVTLPGGGRKYIRAKTKRELDRKVLEFQIAQAQGQPTIAANMTVEELAATWLATIKKPSVKPQSFPAFEHRVQCHLIPALGQMQIGDVRMVHIVDAINNHGYKTRETNKEYLATVRAIFKFAVDNELLGKSPVPDRMTVNGKPTRNEKPLTPNQTKMLLDYCKADRRPGLYLFTLLALVTGMRRGEIAALRWDCVDLQNAVIQVRRNMIDSTGEITDELKTAAAKRDIPIAPDVVALLKRVRSESTSTYVITGPKDGHITTTDIQRYGRAWNRAGVTPEPIHAHLFRKTFATRLIETGTDPKRVQYLLGHATLEMTLQVYAKYDQASQDQRTREIIQEAFLNVL